MHLFRRLTGDRGLRDIARGSLRVLVVRLTGAVAGFGFHLLAARHLGAGPLGAYYLALSVAIIASLVARMGQDNALLRFAAAAADRGDWPELRGIRVAALGLVTAVSLLVTGAVLLSAEFLAGTVFDKPDLAGIIRIMALSITPFSLLNLQGEAFKATGAGVAATAVQGLGVPLAGLVLLAALGRPGMAAGTVAWIHVAATSAVCVASLVAWQVVARRAPAGRAGIPLRRMLATGLPLLLVASIGAAMAPASTFLLGIWLPVESVGLYGVAQRCAGLMILVFTAVSTVTAPRFAALFEQGRMAELGAVARRGAIVAAILAAPLLVLFLPLGRRTLAVFGPDFPAAAGVLAVLAVGRYLAVITGNANDLMMMTGQEKVLRNFVAATTVAYFALFVLLVPARGIDGAALARAVTVVATNVLSVIHIHRRVGINLLPGPLHRRRSEP